MGVGQQAAKAPKKAPPKPAGVTVESLSRLNVTDKIEVGACVQRKTQGMTFPCTRGPVETSWGESCATHDPVGDGLGAESKETACVKACPSGFSNDFDCKLKQCVAQMAGKVYFRTYAALDDAVKQRLASDYDTLIKLVKAEGTPAYATLGGDKERARVKRDILGEVIAGLIDDETGNKLGPGEMLPYGTCALEENNAREHVMASAVKIRKQYGAAPQVATGNAGDASPMETSAVGDLNVYEAAFYDCAKPAKDLSRCEGGVTVDPPDMLAAEVVHELVHFKQDKYGHAAGAQGVNTPASQAETVLNELMAYGMSGYDIFYRDALTAEERAQLVDAGERAQVNAFAAIWPGMGKSDQEDVALWAWKVNWMRAHLVNPGMDAPQAKIWTAMCGALKRKMPSAPCGGLGMMLLPR